VNPIEVALDPGKHRCGVAWYDSQGYVCDWLSVSDAMLAVAGKRGIVEFPRVLPSTPDPEDILQLARVAGRAEQAMATCQLVRPNEWKGSVSKELHNRRVLESLGAIHPASLPRIQARLTVLGTKAHNAIDALGLLLYGLKLTNSRGTPYVKAPCQSP